MERAGANVAAVVLAGGGGTRFGGLHNKVYLPLAGRRVVSWSLDAMSRVPEIKRVILLRAGKVAFSGDPDNALTPERLKDVFGAAMHVERSGAYYHVRLADNGSR